MFEYKLRKKITDIYGLDFEPSIEPYFSDKIDYPIDLIERLNFTAHKNKSSVSRCNIEVLRNLFKELEINTILEIGAQLNHLDSITRTIRQEKKKEAKLLSIDKEFRRKCQDVKNNIWFYQTDSFDQVGVRNKLKQLKIEKIDLLVIDGWHSVEAVTNDWKYCDLLSEKGAVVIHDTNIHPCKVILEAIDKKLFDVTPYCVSCDDWGITVCRKKY